MKNQYDLNKLKARPGKVKVDPGATKTMISLRIDSWDISLLKDEAERMGVPYQTLIGSILHRFVTGELIDKNEARKITK